jgi:hypothetical protein
VIVALVHMIWWVPVNRPRHSELHLGVLQLVYADAYVLIAIAALAASGVSALRRRRGHSRARAAAPAARAWRASSARAG